MRGKRLHALKRPKLRQSWNKYNLYNFWRQRDPKIGLKDDETFFQQKWRAKGLLRSYHGEHVRERDWERMFSRRLLSVANMDARYMAEWDGSEQAAGRGSGQDKRPNWNAPDVKPMTLTPYMNMAFAPLERRLDVAVFRALFASSARQARGMCVHGHVKVNGKVTPHPTYKLNPGDMISVNPDIVMFATGRPKGKAYVEPTPSGTASAAKNKKLRELYERGVCYACRKPGHLAAHCPGAGASEQELSVAEAESDATVSAQQAAAEQDPDTTDAPEAPVEDMKPTREAIQSLMSQAKLVLAAEAPTLKVKQKRDLRSFIKQAKPLLSRAGRPSATPSDIASELTKMVSELNLVDISNDTQEAAAQEAASSSETREPPKSIDDLTTDERKALERLIREEEENPIDPSKPYATPWRPRSYMAPFAFIPKYLEVNQNVCSAVYLRHPVARVGRAEVPTPYGYRINQLAFNWYLRRR
ncbi:putative 30S ribosomal subunit S4 [Pseudomassariella vexata]|uniref:Putative 30S ribosomal subunit S4 n=1 Tax=Pseudomassariella vexata TaxID=1141098 RepID=A0A1Y2E2D4_9PEZI|nr:putative 30S ribosomal subunit S4 [Pseudomassariella vexata]ORY65025.1 putative 30S ribosomal subunit S4 [Pseudomassariella vexata]